MDNFGLPEKAVIFYDYKGKLVRIITHNSANFVGTLEEVTNETVTLRPRLTADPVYGCLVHTDTPLTLRHADVLTPEPITEELYAKLQAQHPWRQYIGEHVFVATKPGQGYPGILQDITAQQVVLGRFINNFGDRNEIARPLAFERGDVLTVQPISEEAYNSLKPKEQQLRLPGM